jgi:integrase
MGGAEKLSAAKVEKTKSPGRYGDGRGLWLHVGPTGTKSWVLRYMRNGTAREMGLGPVHLVGLADARTRAREARRLILEGIDPIEARQAARDAQRIDAGAAMTFKSAAAAYLATHEAGWRNAKHRQQWRNTLKQYAFPGLGKRPVAAIDGALVSATLALIWRKKPETASRVKQRIERIVRWVKNGMPLPVPGKTKRVKHHSAMKWAALPEFVGELRSRDGISARALEFLILCATRTSETIGARWDEINFSEKTWTIPAQRMKAGKQHRVPLSDRAIEILQTIPREAGSEFVFAGGKAKQPLSNMALLELLRGMRPGLTVHGFRSAFKDWCAETTNYPNIVSEAALAHTIPDRVEAAYRRGELFDKRRRLMRDWARFVSQPPAAGDVVPLRARP